MSVKDQLTPYLNRFDILLKQNENASLEITCHNGKVIVNLKHKLSETLTTENKPTSNEHMEKKVKTSQFNRLQMRAIARAEKAKQDLAKYLKEAENAKLEAEHAKNEAAKSVQEQENSKTKSRKANIGLSRLKHK